LTFYLINIPLIDLWRHFKSLVLVPKHTLPHFPPLAAQSNVPVKEENEFIVMMTHYFLFLKLQEIKQISKFKSFQNLSSSI
jgi:hypothetical protein